MGFDSFDRVTGALSRVASSLAGASSIDDVMSIYLKEARGVVPARAVGIYLSRSSGRPPLARADGVSEYYLERYEEVGRQVDPVLQAVFETGEARSSSQMMSLEEWRASEFYREVLSVHGFQSTLKAPIVAQGRIIGTLNFGDRDAGAFDHPGDRELASALGHVVGLAVAVAGRIEDLERERAQFSQAFECSDDALVISDLRTGSRHSNAAARRILALLGPEEADLLLEDLLTVNRPRRPTNTAQAEIRGDQHRVVVQPLNLGSDRKVQVARLKLRGGGEAPEIDAVPFTQALLSPRERQIAAAVSLGLHDQQIADTLVLSVHTVKQHLKSIYKKLDVNSRVELTRLVLMRRSPEGSGSAEPQNESDPTVSPGFPR